MKRGKLLLISVILITLLGLVIGIQDIFFHFDQRSIFLSIWILVGIAAYWLLYLLIARKDYIDKQSKDIEKLDKIRADLKKQCLELAQERAEWEIRLAEVQKRVMEEEAKLEAISSPLGESGSGKLH